MNAHPTLSIETATQLAVSLLIVPARWRACVMRQCRDQHLRVGYIRYVSNPTKALMLLGEAGVLALETDVLTIETAWCSG